jgi:3-oxoacyl-[acyl-carrier-protein] synthase-1
LEEALSGIFARIVLVQLGHAGSLVALSSAAQVLAESSRTGCVVAGADSYLEPDTLEWLEESGQLHGAGPRNNAWGFVPGEGAGAILLLSPRVVEQAVIKPLGRLTSFGRGRESNVIRTGSVCLGQGLTTAFRGAFAGLPSHVKITDVYCDMNGDPYRADEFAFAVARARERFVAPTDFVAPADCWGDVGAASAALFIVLACIAGVKRYSKGSVGLVWASSETGERGAAVITTAADQ